MSSEHHNYLVWLSPPVAAVSYQQEHRLQQCPKQSVLGKLSYLITNFTLYNVRLVFMKLQQIMSPAALLPSEIQYILEVSMFAYELKPCKCIL